MLPKMQYLKGLTVTLNIMLVINGLNSSTRYCIRTRWFFEYDFDKRTKDLSKKDEIKKFLISERNRGINTSLIIGGEPTLHPKRLELFAEIMEFNSISTNGLKALPKEGFKDFSVLISLFGGGSLDDDLRAIKPNGNSSSGL